MRWADDVILSPSYCIDPFDVEFGSIDHKAVAEAAVVPEPARRHGIIRAFIVRLGVVKSNEGISKSIQTSIRERLAAHEYSREIKFVDKLPKTSKIHRTELREW